MTTDDQLRIAVFIDFDNIEIGVRSTMGASFDAGLVLEALKERGEVLSKTAYSDWQRATGYSRMLTQHAIKMVQRNVTPGGDKNGADINLALDALEMAFTHSHINAFVIVGGDSDFISLVEKLKQYGKKVFIVGGRQFTSGILQRNCHEFIAYENLAGVASTGGGASSGGRRDGGRDRAGIEHAIPLVTRALKILADREVSPQLGLLKSTLLQLDSTFSERTYGAGSFRDFAQKLERAGVLRVQQTKGGWIVVSADGTAATEPAAPDDTAATETPAEPVPPRAASGHRGQQPPVPAVVGTAADGIRELRRILTTANVRRWPMYLRNVKQILRQVSPTFDERAYGFSSLVDILRAAQREDFVRVDRDRQGVVRVFQGGAFAPVAEAPPTEEPPVVEATIEELAPVEVVVIETERAPGPADVVVEMMDAVLTEPAQENVEPAEPGPGGARRHSRRPRAKGRKKPTGR